MITKTTGAPIKDQVLVYYIAGVFVCVGILLDLIFAGGLASSVARASSFLLTFGSGGLLAFAAFATGSLFGLLFGIPKGQNDGSAINVSTTSGTEKFLPTNNNLVEISDWLTKVLVGATLTQLNNLPAALAAFGRNYGTTVGSETVAISLLTGFSATGFLSGYLFTKVVLQAALHRANKVPDDAKDKSTAPKDEASDPDPPGAGKDTKGKGKGTER
jgi:hypothetical protein